MKKIIFGLWVSIILVKPVSGAADLGSITVGSKAFTESFILSEAIAQIIEGVGEAKAVRKFGIGGTGLVYEALKKGDIDIYSEYTGTISEAILKNPNLKTSVEILNALTAQALVISEPYGFNNTYALAIKSEEATGIDQISDLKSHSNLRLALTHEFLKRSDGYEALVRFYNLSFKKVRGVSHTLAFKAIEAGQTDIIDVYSTDAQIEVLKLKVLKDDREFFPKYLAVSLMRKDLPERFPNSALALSLLAGQISENEMIQLNARVDIQKQDIALVARQISQKVLEKYFKDHPQKVRKSDLTQIASEEKKGQIQRNISFEEFKRLLSQHLQLVIFSLIASICIGIPLGLVSVRVKYVGQMVIAISGVLQTIPSIALLCFLIPILGIGKVPAFAALFIYGLLPIVVGVDSGMRSIDPRLLEAARSLRMTPFQTLVYVELPLAARNIVGGIKTSAITSIGTATLAALIGGGGFGVPIMTGLALNDIGLILAGAIPAAVLAVLAHSLFYFAERFFVPKI